MPGSEWVRGSCNGFGAALLLAAVAALPPAAVHAEETFVCEDGSIVTVLPGQLEAMKRSDPCVAAYFRDAETGMVPAPSVAEQAISAAPVTAPPLPERRPEEDDDLIASKLRSLEPDASDSASSRESPVSIAGAAPQAPSDFRNVLILNARPGGERYFKHTR